MLNKTFRQLEQPCPWCNSKIELIRSQGNLFTSCIDCEFEIEHDTQDLIEEWKASNFLQKADKTVSKEPQEPTTLVDCPNCEGDDSECWCCLGSGSVWEDQYGERIAKIDDRNIDGFDY